MSERKPGVSSSAPPNSTNAPSITSRAGARPACSASLKRRQTAPPLRAREHRAEDRVRDGEQRDRPPHADRLADLDQHRQLGDRDDDEEDDQEEPHRPWAVRADLAERGRGPGLSRTAGSRSARRTRSGGGSAAARRPARACGPARAGAARGRLIHDHRGVGEGEVGEVDDHVAGRAQRSGDRSSPPPARRPVLVPRDDQDGQLFIETDDRGNLLHTCGYVQVSG